MLYRKGQVGDWEEIIKFILIAPILLALIGAIFVAMQGIGQQNCPTCDCSQYQNQNTNLTEQLEICKNQTKEVIYVNQTVEKPVNVSVEKPVYKDGPVSTTIIVLSLVISLALTIFSFKIRLPRHLEEKLEKIEKAILWFKIGSLIITILIFIKLLIILI